MSHLETQFSRWKSRWTASVVEAVMLDIISSKPRYAGELIEICRQLLDDSVKVPTVYSTIKRLQETGMIKENSQEAEEGLTRGTKRNYYRLSVDGETYLDMIRTSIQSTLDVLSFEHRSYEKL